MAVHFVKNLGVMIVGLLATCQSALSQCAKFSVDPIPGPDCPILPSFAGGRGISETGAICGGYVDCAEVGHNVIWWPNGGVTELPLSTEGGFPGPLALNGSGEVVGRLQVPALEPTPDRAFLYSDGVTINLGALPGHNWAEAVAINASGVVVGSSNNSATGPLTAFVWQAGKMTALPLPYGPTTQAFDISDSGQVCGRMGPHLGNDAHAFIYDLANGRVIDVGTPLPGTNNACATGVTNAGVICGWSGIPCGDLCIGLKGFIWNNGVVQDVGVLPGKTNTRPLAINNSNVIVGYCDPGGSKAFIWQNGVMKALNELIPAGLNLNIRIAWDINNAGQIVASATYFSNPSDQLAVRLTPIQPPPGDCDCNGHVGIADLLNAIGQWGPTIPTTTADFDNNGTVNIHDLLILIANWD